MFAHVFQLMEETIKNRSSDKDPVEYDNLEIVSNDRSVEVNSSTACVLPERFSKV